MSECTSDSGVPYRSNHPCRRLHLALLLSLIRLRAVVYRSTYGNRPCQGASLSSAPTAISLLLSMTGSKVVKRRRVCKDINYRETSCFVSCSRRRCYCITNRCQRNYYPCCNHHYKTGLAILSALNIAQLTRTNYGGLGRRGRRPFPGRWGAVRQHWKLSSAS